MKKRIGFAAALSILVMFIFFAIYGYSKGNNYKFDHYGVYIRANKSLIELKGYKNNFIDNHIEGFNGKAPEYTSVEEIVVFEKPQFGSSNSMDRVIRFGQSDGKFYRSSRSLSGFKSRPWVET